MALNHRPSQYPQMHAPDDNRSADLPRGSSSRSAATTVLPVVSLAGLAESDPRAMARIATEIDEACHTVGFFGVVDHAVSIRLRDDALAVGSEFFALPAAVKERLRVACPPGVQRGFAALGAEAQAAAVGDTTPPDLSETFSIAPLRPKAIDDPWSAPDVWPDADFPRLRPVLSRYRAAADLLARQLLRVCALALRGNATGFDSMLSRPLGGTRINHYPAVAAPVRPDQWRSGPHTDYGTLTVLATDAVAGLEIRVDGVWHGVTAPRNGFLVNIGDFLAAASRQRWTSTWHRVAVPTEPRPPSRTSIAFFQFPADDTPIDLDWAWTDTSAHTAGEYLRERVGRINTQGQTY
jgi:isopenicillin N synthase-like dioxygenase